MAIGKKTGGRQKGSVNHLTQELKEMVLCSLHAVGGIEYLKKQALKNPSPYLSLLSKILPLKVQGDPDKPLIVTPVTEQDRLLIQRYLTQKGNP